MRTRLRSWLVRVPVVVALLVPAATLACGDDAGAGATANQTPRATPPDERPALPGEPPAPVRGADGAAGPYDDDRDATARSASGSSADAVKGGEVPAPFAPFAGGAAGGGAKFPAGEGPRFRGTVALAPEFAALDGRHTLWIIVRSKEGRGAPIAVQRVERAAFPVSYDVGAEHTTTQSDDSYDILKGELKVTARLSISGGAIAAPGDVECEAVLMKGDDPDAALVLDRRRE